VASPAKPLFTIAALLICAWSITAGSMVVLGQVSEADVKAAFLFNFAKFVDWPPQVFSRPDSPFTICLLSDPFNGTLDKLVRGETLDGHHLVVRRVKSREDFATCQILYFSTAPAVSPDIAAAANQPILTVGDNPDFINQGGIIRFVTAGGKVRFQINPEAATRASLKISSRLLNLAEIVGPVKEPGAGL
jgi:hypothetical protein